MKILEAQSATLTNYEVYTHLNDMKEDWQKRIAKAKAEGKRLEKAGYEAEYIHTRRPGNLETISSQVRGPFFISTVDKCA